jgi:hypothetical protein
MNDTPETDLEDDLGGLPDATCSPLKIMNIDKLTAAEAVFGFAAWLTTKDGDTPMGRGHDAAPIADLCKEFVEANNLNEPREDWNHNLIHPSGECSHGNDSSSSANATTTASPPDKILPELIRRREAKYRSREIINKLRSKAKESQS